MRYPATAGATTPIMFAAQFVIPSNVPAKLDAMSRWTHLLLHHISSGHSVLEGGGLEKVLILKRFLHFSGQSDGGEW